MSTFNPLTAQTKNQFSWVCRKIPRPTDQQYNEWYSNHDYNAIVYHALPLIAYILRTYVGSYDDYLDIVQDCVVHILEVLPKYDPSKGCKLSSWLYVIIRHHIYNYLRLSPYQVSLNGLMGDSEDSLQDFLIDPSPTPHEAVLNRSEYQVFYAKVRRMLKPCNERDRKMIMEYLFSDESVNQTAIARKYGVSKQYFSQVFLKRLGKYKK